MKDRYLLAFLCCLLLLFAFSGCQEQSSDSQDASASQMTETPVSETQPEPVVQAETAWPIYNLYSVSGIEEEKLQALLSGEEESLELKGSVSFVVGFGGQITLDSIVFEWEIPPATMRLIDTDYIGVCSYQEIYESDTVAAGEMEIDCNAVESAYIVVRINENGSEADDCVLSKIQFFGERNYPEYLDTQTEIIIPWDDEQNPLNPWRQSIQQSAYTLADEILGGNESLSPHQKIIKFIEYMRGFRVGSHPSDTICTVKDRIGACGSYTNLLVALCATQEIPSRMITMANYPKNTGHVVAEVYIDGRWQVYDSTYGVYFTTTPEEAENPILLSFEELRSGRGSDPDVTEIVLFEEKVTSDMARGFISPEIYVQANPAGVFGPDKPMIYPLYMNITEDAEIIKDEFTTAYQGIKYVGAAGINNFQQWTISGLIPGQGYTFILSSYYMGGDLSDDTFKLKVSAESADLESPSLVIFDRTDPETMVQEIHFIPQSDTIQLTLTHDYLGPEYHYIYLDRVAVSSNAEE